MTGYARLSNDLWKSPKGMKALSLNPAALGYYCASISYCSDNLTDGHLSEDVVRYVLRTPDEIIDWLVSEHFWEQSDDGWTIHDYLEHQNSREQIEASREDAAERKRRSRARQRATQTIDDTNEQENVENPSNTTNQSDQSRDTTQPVTHMSHVTDTGLTQESPVSHGRGFNTKHKTQNTKHKSSTNVEEVVAHAREASSATEEENKLIDLWEPGPDCLALADDWARRGVPIDVPRLAAKFRRKLHTNGLAYNRVATATTAGLDDKFCDWIDQEGKTPNPVSKPTPQPQPQPRTPHQHSMSCEHVSAIMTPSRSKWSQKRNGYAPSDWMQACDKAAELLNAGHPAQDIPQLVEQAFNTTKTTSTTDTPPPSITPLTVRTRPTKQC